MESIPLSYETEIKICSTSTTSKLYPALNNWDLLASCFKKQDKHKQLPATAGFMRLTEKYQELEVCEPSSLIPVPKFEGGEEVETQEKKEGGRNREGGKRKK